MLNQNEVGMLKWHEITETAQLVALTEGTLKVTCPLNI